MFRKVAIAGIVLTATWVAAQQRPVDVQASRVTIHAFRAGVFGGLGDNHEIAAPISNGTLDESARRITLRFDARQMRVLDPKLSADKRSQVQERMLGPDVLDTKDFPEIRFESTNIRQGHDGTLEVEGDLILHGHTQRVIGTASKTPDGYRGSFKLRQHDFGIKPVSVAGGTIKVKDELTVDFDIRTTSARTAAQ